MRFIDHARVAGLAALALVAFAVAGAAHAATPGTYEVRLAGIGPARNQIALAFQRPIGIKKFTLTDASLLAHAEPGDVITVEVDDVTTPTTVTKIDRVSRWVGKTPRLETFLAATVVLLGVVAALTRLRPLTLLIGKDGRYSNSQVQLALWFGAVAVVYASAVWVRWQWLGADFIGGVGLTANVIALTGLSAVSFGGAKMITVQKIANAAQAAATSPPGAALPPLTKTPGKPNLLTDLFQNDQGDADLGDLQMILITVAAVGIFVAASFHFLGKLALETPVTLPDVDTALLAGFGIGQGAYLLKKAALPLGQG
jgi:hypothetical protein